MTLNDVDMNSITSIITINMLLRVLLGMHPCKHMTLTTVSFAMWINHCLFPKTSQTYCISRYNNICHVSYAERYCADWLVFTQMVDSTDIVFYVKT